MTSQRLLITGATGFIGRYVMQELARTSSACGYDVIRWSRTQMGSVTDHRSIDQALNAHKPDYVLHLAWTSTLAADYRNSPENHRWAKATCELARLSTERGAIFVGVGTGLEVHPEIGASAYVKSKVFIRESLRAAHALNSWLWLRPFWIFSPEDGRPRVLGEAQLSLAQGKEPKLRNPATKLDFIHVRDVANGIMTAISSRTTGVRDIGSGDVQRVGSLIEMTTGHTDSRNDPEGAEALSEESVYRADVTWLKALGWKPRFTENVFQHIN